MYVRILNFRISYIESGYKTVSEMTNKIERTVYDVYVLERKIRKYVLSSLKDCSDHTVRIFELGTLILL